MKALVTFALLMALGTWTRADQARVVVQWIEISHPDLTTLLSHPETIGSRLHANAMSLVTQGKARIIDTNVIVIDNAASLEATEELIYPTEYEPPGIPNRIPQIQAQSFETRNVGTEFDASIDRVDPFGQQIHLTAPIRTVTYPPFHTWFKPINPTYFHELRMPTFETWNVNANLLLTHGHYELASVIHPKSTTPVPVVEKRILVFFRADMLSTEK
jgi:hypothetical protein